jgi:hypothetical protein
MQMDLRLGAAVRGPGGEHVGTLRRVLVDDQGDVEEIVIRLDGGLEDLIDGAPEVRVPVRQVASATEDGVRVHAGRDELDAYPEYLEERPPTPRDHWQAPPGYTVSDLLGRLALLLGAGANQPPLTADLEKPDGEHQIPLHAPAIAGGTYIGEVTRVLYDGASGRVRALVLHREALDDELVLPAEMVEAVADDAVQVRASLEQIAALDRFSL